LKTHQLPQNRIFKWSHINVWEPKIRALMADVLDERVFTEFHEDPPEFVVGDDLSWLDQIIRRLMAVCVSNPDCSPAGINR
jgi:hypothetical protein